MGSLTIEDLQLRDRKIKSFFGFIDFDWGDERTGDQADWKTGNKKWQLYKEVHGWKDKSDHQRQLMKRKFYSENIEKNFENTMIYKSENDRDNFMLYCQLFNSLGELGFPTIN
jgi:hypothetical protein